MQKYYLDENIDIISFYMEYRRMLELDMVKKPKEPVKVMVDKSGNAVGFELEAIPYEIGYFGTDGTHYILKATEHIKIDNMSGRMVHQKFSFDFRASSENDGEHCRRFRIDFSSQGETPLHAHADNYDDTGKHLQFIKDIRLDIQKIDFITVLLVIKEYISKVGEYPLDNAYAEMYNKIIYGERKKYDDRV